MPLVLRFPPKLDKQSPSLDPSNPLVPSADVAACPSFWSRTHRASIHLPRYKKRDLDARRSHNLVPGTRLDPIAQDDRVPVLLSQRTLGPAGADSTLHGWTLTVPSGWGMPFFASLVYSTPRVGGLRERSHQFYEAGAARYPEDFVGTPGFVEHELRREDDERGYWERRPPAKRPSYDKLGTKWPWRMEMGEVLDLAWRRGTGSATMSKGEGEDGRTGDETSEPFLVAPSVAKAMLAQARAPTSSSADAMDEDGPPAPRARAKQLEQRLAADWAVLSSSPSSRPDSLLRRAMVCVELVPCVRGVPQDLGMVYEVDEAVAEEVKAKMDAAKKGSEPRVTGEYDGAEDVRPSLSPSCSPLRARCTDSASLSAAVRPALARPGPRPHHDRQLLALDGTRRRRRRCLSVPAHGSRTAQVRPLVLLSAVATSELDLPNSGLPPALTPAGQASSASSCSATATARRTVRRRCR